MGIDLECIECELCGSDGLDYLGDYEVLCPVCGAQYSLIDTGDAQSKKKTQREMGLGFDEVCNF